MKCTPNNLIELNLVLELLIIKLTKFINVSINKHKCVLTNYNI